MAVVALCSLVTLLIKLICIVLRWKYIVYKTWSLCWESKAFLSENFIPVTQAGVFVWEKFPLGCWDLGFCDRDLSYQVSPASRMNASKFLQRKEWQGEISETEPARFTTLIWRGPWLIKTDTNCTLYLAWGMSEEPCKAHSQHIKSVSSASRPAPVLHLSEHFLHSKLSVLSWGFQVLCPVGHLQM